MELEDLRKKLDGIDGEIVKLLDERFSVTDEVAVYKDTHNVPLTDTQREHTLIDTLQQQSGHPVVKEHIPQIYGLIIETNKRIRKLRMTKTIPYKKIGFIGIGVIGGSMIKALRSKDPAIEIHALKRSDSLLAKEQGFIDVIHDAIPALTAACDLIVLASPIDTIIAYAESIAQSSTPITVIDVASTKREIADAFKRLTGTSVEFVATHPMAGSEKQGFQGASALLFLDKPWVITPHDRNKSSTLQRITEFIEYLGSRHETMTADEHDETVATVSHLIFLISTYLFMFAHTSARDGLKIAGSGFESTTRLASGNAQMHSQIVNHNTAHIAQKLLQFITYLQTHPVTTDNSLTFFEEAKQKRDQFYSS